MSLILNINTTGETAEVFISSSESVLSSRVNRLQSDHASFIHPAIQQICSESGTELKMVDAIAVCNGPGSYTGIRVGISTAKGLALALDKPLLMADALSILAKDAINNYGNKDSMYCPMIDARRMEVFFAVFNCDLHHKTYPSSVILDENTFSEIEQPVFIGSGSQKFRSLYKGKGTFATETNTIEAFRQISHLLFERKEFSDILTSDAFYVKEFHDSTKS